MPELRTVMGWLAARDEFQQQYARARSVQAELYADDIVEIADRPMIGKKTKRGKDGTEVTTGDCVERSKLRVDARKWVASRLLPRRYGTQNTVTTGNDTLRELLDSFRARHKEIVNGES